MSNRVLLRAAVGIETRLQSDTEFKRTFSSVFEPCDEIEYRCVGDGVEQRYLRRSSHASWVGIEQNFGSLPIPPSGRVHVSGVQP